MREKTNAGHSTNFIPLNTSNVQSVMGPSYPIGYVPTAVITRTPWSFRQKRKKRNKLIRERI
jgi:hypothetical protein